jgi:ribosomal protein S18 acetylase RimI-like enzyme
MPETLELTLARLTDAEPIALMSRDLIEVGLDWRWTPARVAHCIRCPDTLVVIARARGRLVGFAIMYFGIKDAHLLLLAVDPAQRRAATGRRLLEWLEKSARVAGIATIQLEVRAKNQGARAFYRTLGYREVQLMPLYYDGREAAVRLVRNLRVIR